MRGMPFVAKGGKTASAVAWASLLLAVVAGERAAVAQGPAISLTGELLVNQTTASAQDSPAVSMRDNGTHFVVWRNTVGVGDFDVLQRRFPADGSTPFSESGLAQGTAGSQSAPDIDLNGNGNWLALWATSQAGQGLRARTVTSGILGSEFQYSVTTAGTFDSPRASRAEDDSWVAVWTVDSLVSLRRFASTGTPVTGEIELGASLGSITSPAVAAVADGESWVVLRSNDVSTAALFLERYDADGVQIGPSIAVSENPNTDPNSPDIDAAGDGSLVVAWIDTLLGVQLRCFAADGTPRNGELTVDAGVSQVRLAVALDGAAIVTWRTAGSSDIRAREFDRTCRPVGAAFTVNSVQDGTQRDPDAGISADRFVIVWSGPGAGGDGDGAGVARRIYRRRSLYADSFESNDLASWSAVVP